MWRDMRVLEIEILKDKAELDEELNVIYSIQQMWFDLKARKDETK